MLKGFALVRHLEEVVRHLAEKGHTVILTEAKRKASRTNIPDAVARLPSCSTITGFGGWSTPFRCLQTLDKRHIRCARYLDLQATG